MHSVRYAANQVAETTGAVRSERSVPRCLLLTFPPALLVEREASLRSLMRPAPIHLLTRAPFRSSPRTRPRTMRLALLLASLLFTGCDVDRPPEAYSDAPTETATAEPMLAEARARMTAAADSMDAVLRPVAFLRGSEEAALRRFMSREHLARARRLGITPPDDSTAIGALTRDGSLVRLADSTEHYILRELDHSFPLVTPATAALLEQIGERFQARLAEMGLPPLRIEVSSVLRTAALQADLRHSNSNAARGSSAHEFGTTVDVAYNSFAAPGDPVADLPADAPVWLRPHLRWMDRLAVERIAAQRSGELKAILGRVLIEMQSEGLVLIILEERQPVYHLTVAR